MKGLFSVFKFEFINRITQKSIKNTTIIIAALLFIATFIPRFFDVFGAVGSFMNVDDEDNINNTIIGYVVENNSVKEEDIPKIISFGKTKVYSSNDELEKAVEFDEIESGYIFNDKNIFTEITKDSSMYNQDSIIVKDNMNTLLRNEALESQGINPEIVDEASVQEIEYNTINLGKKASSGFIFAFIGMLLTFLIITFFGAAVATLVAREKNDRTMEILITNTSSTNLIVGKVFASTLTCFLQIFIILAITIIGFVINKSFYPPFIIDFIAEGIPIDAFLIFFIFLLLGALMYFFLYAAFGALVTKVEEVNNAVQPIQLLVMIGYFIAIFSMNTPDSPLMTVGSLVPITSPLIFFLRYTMTTVPIYQTLLSIVLLILTTIVLAFISIRIYRMGTLNYGNKMTFFKTVKKLFEKED